MSSHAEQLEFFSVPSPCVRVCTVGEDGFCQGCMRKREERFNWLSYTAAQQLHIIKLCRQRYRRKLSQGEIPRGEVTLGDDTTIEFQDDLFSTIKQYVDQQDLKLSKKVEKELKEVLDDKRDLDSLSNPTIRALFFIVREIFLPFVLSCLATIFMEQADFIRDVFKDVPREDIKKELKRHTFPEEYRNHRVIVRNDIMRRDPSPKGEITAFLDVGDVVEVLDIYDGWVYVRVEVDGEMETGWIASGVSQKLIIQST